jgi:phosphomannomutase
MKKIEEEMSCGPRPKGNKAPIEEVDLKKAYVDAVCRFVDMEAIGNSKRNFAVDAMYGSGRGVLSGIFRERGVEHVAIREELNPLSQSTKPLS